MKLPHKQKVKLARKMQTPDEDRKYFGIFQSRAWIQRGEAIQKRLAKRKEKFA